MATKKSDIADMERMIEENYPEFLSVASILTKREMSRVEKYIDPRYREIVRHSFRLVSSIRARIKRLIGYYNISADVLDLHFDYDDQGDLELSEFTIIHLDDLTVDVVPSYISLEDLDRLEDITAETFLYLDMILPC